MSTIDDAPKPWEKPFKTGDTHLDDPAMEAVIHADQRLSADAKGVLIAILTTQLGGVRGHNFGLNERGDAAMRELYEAGYLRTHPYAAGCNGQLVDATLYGRTLLGQAVAGAAGVRFIGSGDVNDWLEKNEGFLNKLSGPERGLFPFHAFEPPAVALSPNGNALVTRGADDLLYANRCEQQRKHAADDGAEVALDELAGIDPKNIVWRQEVWAGADIEPRPEDLADDEPEALASAA